MEETKPVYSTEGQQRQYPTINGQRIVITREPSAEELKLSPREIAGIKALLLWEESSRLTLSHYRVD